MKTTEIPVSILESLIDTLQSAHHVCEGVDYQSDDTEKSAPYAVGYSRAALSQVIENLQKFVD